MKIDPKELAKGIEIEQEHTDDLEEAERIATEHLRELPTYYTRLNRMYEQAMLAPTGITPAVNAVEELVNMLLDMGALALHEAGKTGVQREAEDARALLSQVEVLASRALNTLAVFAQSDDEMNAAIDARDGARAAVDSLLEDDHPLRNPGRQHLPGLPAKAQRMYEHIKKSYQARGEEAAVAKGLAAATTRKYYGKSHRP